ncbi:MAG TPA: hypothetical protein VMJ10_05885 [Kofleriaceae bacterium]|nr:hypothetical protein [Kofleriaceae bacterium]
MTPTRLAFALVLAASSAHADSPRCDVSTDAGIDAAYKAATGHEMSTYGGRCVERSETFKGLIVVGSFASDLGCRWEGVLNGCKWNDRGAPRAAMAAAGWAKANAAKRQELALAWLREIDQVRVEDEKVTADKDKVTIEYYEHGPVGMTPTPPPRYHYRVVFGADGTHGAITSLK